MNLMQDEKILLRLDDAVLVLTNYRIRYNGNQWGKREVISIMLEDLTSCEIMYTTKPVLILVSMLIAFASLMFDLTATELIVGLVVACVPVIIYYLSRNQVLRLSSASASIVVDTEDISIEAANRFLDVAESSKKLLTTQKQH